MKGQACEPCAKRKVRCDRVEPRCSNCKRRKTDRCVYPEESPFERIKRLEETIKALGGNSSPGPSKGRSISAASIPAVQTVKQTPVIVEEEGRSIYLESQGWQTWIDSTRVPGSTEAKGGQIHKSIHNPGKHLPHAFDGCLWRDGATSEQWLESPPPPHDTSRLWKLFLIRVEPLIKIIFDWTLENLRPLLTDTQLWKRASQGERVLMLSICYSGAVSLSNEECIKDFSRQKLSLLHEYRTGCERLFTRSNMLAIDDVSTLKALCLYIKASLDLVSTQSLWSLMGLASRSAEQLGIQRDGQLLGLSPVETEDRRRLWWQLQHLDLILAIKSGVTPLTFTADWDANLPLNIEDCDLNGSSTTLPQERTGLTSLSYTLFTYWIIGQQRSFRQKRLNQQCAIDRSLLGPLTDMMINELEAGLNSTFLQYCDPIKPLDMLLQIAARGVIGVLRLRRLHEMRLRTEHADDSLRDEYFKTCLQSLKYNVAGHSNPLLSDFRWYSETAFAWHAFIGVLVDIPHINSVSKVEGAWMLLAELYTVIPTLMDLSGDRRRLHAAKSVAATWEACQHVSGLESMRKPAFVFDLEDRISKLGDDFEDHIAIRASAEPKNAVPGEPDFGQDRIDPNEPFNFNFADIDWSFWDSIS